MRSLLKAAPPGCLHPSGGACRLDPAGGRGPLRTTSSQYRDSVSLDMDEAQRRRAGVIMYGAVKAITHRLYFQHHADVGAERSACTCDLAVNIKRA